MNWSVLARSALFEGIGEGDRAALLACLGARERSIPKGQCFLRAGDVTRDLGVVLCGGVDLTREDHWGNTSLLARVGPGGTFAEVYAALGVPLAVDVTAAEETAVLLLNVDRALTGCAAACRFHQRLVRNLVMLLAQKNRALSQKADVLAQRTTREKLLTYLSAQAEAARSDAFTIPFTRQQLADYLAVDRSAMTVELGKLAKEGVLRFEKNRFELL